MLFRPPHDVRPRLVLQLPGVANEADAVARCDLGVADLPNPQAGREQKEKKKWKPVSRRFLACLTRRLLFHELRDPLSFAWLIGRRDVVPRWPQDRRLPRVLRQDRSVTEFFAFLCVLGGFARKRFAPRRQARKGLLRSELRCSNHARH